MKITLLVSALLFTVASTYAVITNEAQIHSAIGTETVEKAIQATELLAKSATDIAALLKQTTPYLIKVGTINLAGLLCSTSGIYMLVKGVQQSCAKYQEEDNNDTAEELSLMQRCLNTLNNPSAKGTYQAGAGLAVFIAGLLTIANSERILLL